jgi:hypothetical protein
LTELESAMVVATCPELTTWFNVLAVELPTKLLSPP